MYFVHSSGFNDLQYVLISSFNRSGSLAYACLEGTSSLIPTPVHSVVGKEPLDVSAGVFGIIVLIEPVGGGKPLCNEWYKGGR